MPALPAECAPRMLLLSCFRATAQVNGQKKKCGFVSPRRFVSRVKAENALFSSYMHQVSVGCVSGGSENGVVLWLVGS